VQALRNDTLAHGEFAKWILKHIDVWFAFARELGLGVTCMEDIILVTGRNLARSWANVAFSESKEGEQVSLGVRVAPDGDVRWQFSREDIRGVAVNCGPSGQVRFFPFSRPRMLKHHLDRYDHTRICPRISAYLSGDSVSPVF
jgi:hypothetical protein